MPQTHLFLRLTRRLKQLEADFLPGVRAGGSYTLQEEDQIRGFRLLAHAECESFIESAVRKVADNALSAYQRTRKPTPVLKALGRAFCSNGQCEKLPVDMKRPH